VRLVSVPSPLAGKLRERVMHRKYFTLILMAFILNSTGCRRLSHHAEMAVDQPSWDSRAGMGLASMSRVTGPTNLERVALAASPQRYIAETHKFEVIAPDSELEKSVESLLAFCATIQCEVVSSSVTTRAEDSTPSGSISVRVAPQDAAKLFAQAEKLGKIAQHTTEREDKITAVIDSEAKIKNLTTFRDNLRSMLAKASATVKDLVDIQQQLMETQSQLDSETAQRKVLANETEKILVELSFRVPKNATNTSSWTQIGNAFRQSGQVLADSTAAVIITVVAIIPWLILILPGLWLLRIILRKLARNRPITPASPATV
jgi:hypothetical protein